MLTMWNGFDRVFDDGLRRMTRGQQRESVPGFGRDTYPRVNVLDTEAALVVSAEVPGFAPENVEVTVHDGVLTIVGKVSDEQAVEGKVVYRERRNVGFKRTFTINTDVDVDRIAAVQKDGLLTVTLPKAEAAKPRQIAVTSAQ